MDCGVWLAIAASVAGASRKKRHSGENQDAAATGSASGSAWAAAADGHGDARHARSAHGARFAAEVTLAALPQFHGSAAMSGNWDQRRELADTIAAGWRSRVLADLESNPLGAGAGEDAAIAYGSTCLGAAASDRCGLFLQLGDGDLVTFERGGASRRCCWQDDLPGEQTRSLCMPSAASLINVEISYWESPPDLVLLATDGLSKSYPDDAGFLRFGTDVLGRLRKPGGPAEVERQLAPWLEYISEHGSGDDISVALLFRVFGEEVGR